MQTEKDTVSEKMQDLTNVSYLVAKHGLDSGSLNSIFFPFLSVPTKNLTLELVSPQLTDNYKFITFFKF